VIGLANKEKQRAEVFASAYWEGAIVVAAAPPGNVKSALAGAVRIANKDRGCNITYFDLIPDGVTEIVWDEPVPTKTYIRDREQALRPPKPKTKSRASRERKLSAQIPVGEFPQLRISERCPLCETPDPGAKCRECGHDMTTVLA